MGDAMQNTPSSNTPNTADLDGTRALIRFLGELTDFFYSASPAVADAVSDHFDDMSAPDWIPLVITDHATRLAKALNATPVPPQE